MLALACHGVNSAFTLVNRVWGGSWTNYGSTQGRVKKFLSFEVSRPAQASIQPPINWVPGGFSSGVKWPGSEADIQLREQSVRNLQYNTVSYGLLH